MNQTAAHEIHEQLNFQASLLRLMNRLETATATTGTADEKVAAEVEKLASRL